MKPPINQIIQELNELKILDTKYENLISKIKPNMVIKINKISKIYSKDDELFVETLGKDFIYCRILKNNNLGKYVWINLNHINNEIIEIVYDFIIPNT